jgi:hypothetical protein
MRAIFIHHGQSTGNAGVPCDDLATIALTELSHAQAREVAQGWTATPSLIVTSPYLRTPADGRTDDRQIPRRAGGGVADRGVHLSATDALERHRRRRTDALSRTLLGGGRPGLLRRGRGGKLRRPVTPSRGRPCAPGCAAHRIAGLCVGHGQFIQAARAIVTEPGLGAQEKMRGFRRKGEPPAISNAELVEFHRHGRSGACAGMATEWATGR